MVVAAIYGDDILSLLLLPVADMVIENQREDRRCDSQNPKLEIVQLGSRHNTYLHIYLPT